MISIDRVAAVPQPQKRSARNRMTINLPPTTTSEVVEMIKSWFTAEEAAALAALLHLHYDDNQSKPTHEGIVTT